MDGRLDTCRSMETPEGVDLTLQVAGPIARVLAFGIDLLVRGTIYLLLSPVLSSLGETGVGIMLVLIFLIEWFYPVLFEVFFQGRTLGKWVFSLAVVHRDGRPVGWGASLLRNLLLFVDFLPAGYLLGLGSMVVSRDFRRLGDHVAETVVVYQSLHPLPPDPPLPPASEARPPRAPLLPEEQQALLAFARRSGQWSPERREEILSILSEVSGGTPAQAVSGVTAWLRGRR